MGGLAPPLKIRAHHLLCLLGFRGLGYNQEFITKMRKVVEKLDSNSTITLVVECDIICSSCPHHKGSKCLKDADSELKVKAQDLEVLMRLGFEAGAQMPVVKAWARIKERLSFNDIAEICRHCEWLELGYCVQGLERLKPETCNWPWRWCIICNCAPE
ncbi:DUF1284 domain-containing protein [Dehalococcoidia bacterium]|nr:DUF1284 domain-containing protein [Dehalococcoidia bacterium]